jgi:hypothetical protein
MALSRPSQAAIATGALLGLWYALSPLMVVLAMAVCLMGALVTRGLGAEERRWIVAILLVALTVRLVLIAWLFLIGDHTHSTSFFWDGDGLALKRRALWIRSYWMGQSLMPIDFWNAFDRLYGWTTYLYVIAYLQYLVGPAPYSIHLVNVVLFIGAACMLYRLARSAYGPVPALIGFVILLFVPTPLLWSVSALKESLYLFIEICGTGAMIIMVRARSWPVKAIALGVLVASLAAVATVRAGGFAIMAGGLGFGLCSSFVLRRPVLMILMLTLAPVVAYRLIQNPGVQGRAMAQLRTSAVLHIGNVRTKGHSYKLLDQRFYSGPQDAIDTMTPIEGARFAIRAIESFVAVPLPWQVETSSEIAFFPQQVLWYALVLLAAIGFGGSLKQDALFTCTMLGFVLMGGLVIALNSGNIGTMVRHRDTIVPFIVWLSANGMAVVLGMLVPFRPDTEARAVCL